MAIHISKTNSRIPSGKIVRRTGSTADDRWHGRAVQRLQLENKVGVSLTDCLSFEIMEDREIAIAFTFDRHFTERGFAVAESHGLDGKHPNGE